MADRLVGLVLVFPAADVDDMVCLVPGKVTGVEPGPDQGTCRVHLDGTTMLVGLSVFEVADAVSKTIAGHESPYQGWTKGSRAPPPPQPATALGSGTSAGRRTR